jgi:hypothetical protein
VTPAIKPGGDDVQLSDDEYVELRHACRKAKAALEAETSLAQEQAGQLHATQCRADRDESLLRELFGKLQYFA